MSTEPKNAASSNEAGGSVAGRLDRRLFVMKSALGAALVAGGSSIVLTPAAEARPIAPEVRSQRRSTDNDPWDPVGRGRGVGRPPVRRRVTDSDPWDPAGRGRGVVRRPRRRVTDSDPWDAVGRGRGW